MKHLSVAHVSYSALSRSGRIIKELRSTAQLIPGCRQIYLGCKGIRDMEMDTVDIVEFANPIADWSSRRSLIIDIAGYVMWLARVLFRLVAFRPDIIHCHNVKNLPVCVLAKLLTGARLLYDAHELETELDLERTRVLIAKAIERSCVRAVDAIITPTRSITRWYKDHYPHVAETRTVSNAPRVEAIDGLPPSPLRDRLGIPAGDLIFLYIGMIDQTRGIELMCEAFAGAKPDRHLVFLGDGGQIGDVKDKMPGCANIHLHPSVPFNELHGMVTGADVGLMMTDSMCLSNIYGMGSKLLQYIFAGLPAIVTDVHIEKANFVKENNCGWPAPLNPEGLRQVVDGITREQIAAMKPSLMAAREKFGWDKEELVLMDLYQTLAGRP